MLTIIYGVLAAPMLLATISRREPESALRILIIPQLTRVGDLVCATPTFRAVKARYPDAHLTVLVSKKVVSMIRHNPHIGEIVIIEDYRFFALAKKLRAERFDWSVSLAGVSTMTLLMLFARIPRRIKTTRSEAPVSERLTDWMATDRVFYAHHTYLPGHYLKTLVPLDIHDDNAVPEVFPTPEGERKAEAFVAEYGRGKPLIGISITAGNKIKEWGDERFTELARELHFRYDATLVFLGGLNDEARIAAVIERIGAGENVAATGFSLDELPSLMKRFALFIAVDTGPIYIAHALGVPLIDIIGPVDPSEQPPLGEKSVQVLPAAGVAPSSFVFKRPGTAAEHQRAVASIPIAKVLEAVATLASRGFGVRQP